MFGIEVSIFFIVLFFFLGFFCFVGHPIYYWGLLVLNSIIWGLICYIMYGFSWYSLLLCLVYVGGVYILFLFVSVFSPNSSVVFYFGSSLMVVLGFFCCIFVGLVIYFYNLETEFSSFLCNISEGWFYLVMCFTVVFGFVVLSLVMSIKSNYYR
uniref:NADH dehydrogenase subunit 6 n=1 Tax=Mesocestoides sp. RKZ08 TaxID=2854038 RepID=UPI001F12BBF7|nr:NADH dehydrogenase subunit 6 [Mesocestoides sp. RKZ08]UKS07972.1 NADH dehydrogenase subunit 6 [Mesocestoides sp. RKZ08]